MKKLLFILIATIIAGCTQKSYDVCIYGGTSAGVIAARSAANLGLNVILVEPTGHIGGLTTGGLGFTDIGNKQVVSGLAKQFYRKVGSHYGTLEQWVFEPSVADSIMHAFLDTDRIRLVKHNRLIEVEKIEGKITKITLEDPSGRTRTITADYFIDTTYEGDLMALAGVSYTVGREPNSQYGEQHNGSWLAYWHQFPDGVDPYVEKGNPESGLLPGIDPEPLGQDGNGDARVQAYNYRICLTDDVENMIPITEPEGYDPDDYELLVRLFEAQPEQRRLRDYFIWSMMPNRKTDVNNYGAFSTDMIGANYDYPEGSYEVRDSIIKAHERYTKGLLYFFGHDPRVPDTLRTQMLRWGYPKDEYVDNGNWTPQLYVREARRMVSGYVATDADCMGLRAPEDGIALAAYQMDSHNTRRVVVEKNGAKMLKNEGDVEIEGGLPYPISYRSIIPKREECVNLVVPVCLSASHIAFGSIRMEPVFMVLGQIAAMAVAQADGRPLHEVSAEQIRIQMEEDPYLDGSVSDVLIDDVSGGADIPEDWTTFRKTGGFGPSWAVVSDKSAAPATFSAVIPEKGRWSLYIHQNVDVVQSSVIPVKVMAPECEDEVVIEKDGIVIQGQTSSTWVKVGTYEFAGEDSVEVSLMPKKADGALMADAILFTME